MRERYNIQAGDTFRMLDLDGVLITTPMAPMVPELAREIERTRIAAGLTIEELLLSLREEREQYYAENYGEADDDTETIKLAQFEFSDQAIF